MHQCLCGQVQYLLNHDVCHWYHCCWPDQQRWDKVQVKDWETCVKVSGQSSSPQCQHDDLRKRQTHPHQQSICRDGRPTQDPGHPYHQHPNLVPHTVVMIMKSRRHIYFQCHRKTFGMNTRIPPSFYKCSIQSTLTRCISAWHGKHSALDRMNLQRVVNTPQSITCLWLSSNQSISMMHCIRKIESIVRMPTILFSLLSAGSKYKRLTAWASRLKSSFFPAVVRFLNPSSLPHPFSGSAATYACS